MTDIRRTVIRIAQLDKEIRGDRWRPLIRGTYNIMARFYDAGADLLLPGYRQAALALLDHLAIEPQDRLLDLGCGTGMVAGPAAERAGWVLGLDLTPGMLRQLQGKARSHATWPLALMRGDARYLPVSAGSFDVVTTSFMLLHLTTAEKQAVFAESRRVLTAAGRLGCLTSREGVGDAYPTAGEWRGWLHNHGFEEIEIVDLDAVYRLVLARQPGI